MLYTFDIVYFVDPTIVPVVKNGSIASVLQLTHRYLRTLIIRTLCEATQNTHSDPPKGFPIAISFVQGGSR